MKQYNKEEVMKEFEEVMPKSSSETISYPHFCGIRDFFSASLTAAEQAGEERMREKVKEIIPLEQERTLSNFTPPEYYDGFNRCREVMRLNLEALK